MNNKQFNEIKSRLADWREERHLTYENQQKRFLGNIFEEVSEYFRAKDDYERIDALCDIAVFCINSYDVSFEYFKYKEIERDSIIEDIIIDFGISICGSKIHRFEEWAYKTLCKIECLVSNLGFDFYKCMIEAIKEIESRSGHYDDELGKFIKNRGAYTEEEAYRIAKSENVFFNFGLCKDKKTMEEYWEADTNDSANWKRIKIKKWYKANYEDYRIRG